MSGGFTGWAWEYAQSLSVSGPEGGGSREFKGFIQPQSMSARPSSGRRPGLRNRERYRLLAHPEEDFFRGRAAAVRWGERLFELLAVKEVYIGDALSHRECVLLEMGEAGDA